LQYNNQTAARIGRKKGDTTSLSIKRIIGGRGRENESQGSGAASVPFEEKESE
jgi:hypothetical protein